MRIQFIFFLLMELILSIFTLTLSRLFTKDFKAGMMISLFCNCINLIISLLMAIKRIYFNLYIVYLCLCFTMCSFFYYFSFYLKIPSVTFANYYSLRIIIVGILSLYVLKRKLTPLQVSGKVLVVIGVSIQVVVDNPLTLQPFILTAILSAFFNAISAVLFETKIKNGITDTFEYIFTFNVLYMPFNLITALLEHKKNTNHLLFTSWIFYTLVLSNVFSTYMSLYLSMNCDSFERTIISNVCGLSSCLVSDLIILKTINMISLLGFLFVSLGVFLYMYNKRVDRNKQKQTTSIS